MEEHEERPGWAVDAARVLTGAAGWTAIASFVSPWSREQGTAEVGFSGLAGIRDLGAVDVQGRGPVWLDTVHWAEAWVVLAAALVLWAAATLWRRRPARVVALGISGLLVLLGVAAIVLPLVSPGDGSPWYGPYLTVVAGVAGLVAGLLGRPSEPVVTPARPGEICIRESLVDLGLDRHAAPRLIRLVWAVLVTVAVGAYLVTVVGTVFDDLAARGEPAWVQGLSALAAVVLASLALGAVLVVLRVVVEFLVVPFRIVDGLRPPEPSVPVRGEPDHGPPSPPEPEPPAEPDRAIDAERGPEAAPPPPPERPSPTESPPPSDRRSVPWAGAETSGSEPTEPEPWVAPQRPRTAPPEEDTAQEPEPWGASVEPRPSVKLHGTAEGWYRREASGEPLPEARGIPEEADQRHPLRRPRAPDEDTSAEPPDAGSRDGG